MKVIVTMEITIDEEACEEAGITADELRRNRLIAAPDPLRNGACVVTDGPEGHEFDRFITDCRIITTTVTRSYKRKDQSDSR